jgi:hypothetical protein
MNDGKQWISPKEEKIQFVRDAQQADYHIIINAPRPNDAYDPHKAIFLRMEPKIHGYMFNGFDNPMPHQYRLLTHEYNAIEWHLDRSFPALQGDLKGNPLSKTKVISTITSGLRNDPVQRLRLDFLNHADSIPGFDFYGRDHSPLKSYRGALPRLNKNDGLLPYRYTIACENCLEEDYATEKLIDGILAECVVFYYGHPSITKRIDPQAFIFIDLNDPIKSLGIIKTAIQNDEYSKRIGVIRQMKAKILNELQIMPMLMRSIARIQEQDQIYNNFFNNPRSEWRLINADKFPPGLRSQITQKLIAADTSVSFGDATAVHFNTSLPGNISPVPVKSKLTIVTGYFTMKSKRPNNQYLEWCQYFCSLNCQMIIFTDYANYPFFQKLRSTSNTRIYLKEIEDFEVNKILPYWRYCADIDRESNHSVELYMLWSERHVSLMSEAIRINPFGSEFFFWIDIGSIRSKPMLELVKGFPNEEKMLKQLPTDKFILCRPITEPIPNLEIATNGILKVLQNGTDDRSCGIFDQIQGGFLGGNKDQWKKWTARYCEHLQLFINTGTFGGKDQAIITNIYFTDPNPSMRYTLLQGVKELNGLSIDPWFTSLYRFC